MYYCHSYTDYMYVSVHSKTTCTCILYISSTFLYSDHCHIHIQCTNFTCFIWFLAIMFYFYLAQLSQDGLKTVLMKNLVAFSRFNYAKSLKSYNNALFDLLTPNELHVHYTIHHSTCHTWLVALVLSWVPHYYPSNSKSPFTGTKPTRSNELRCILK